MLPMVSSPKASLSPCSDPEEKEISEDDDDDRNHKHRRRDDRSQSQEGDLSEQVFTRPYRKRDKPFENGHSYRGGGSHYGNHNMFSQERDASGRFDKKRQHGSFARTPFELSQRTRNQGEVGWTRGRGRAPPSFFGGRGLPNVHNASWNSYGMIPAIPNGGLEPLHSIGMPGGLNSSMGIPRARCRDFEERGFCLRGDMCPMEHGVNRIVVEDVQSLSQFNLPVSLPGARMLGTPGGQGPLPANVPSGTLSNKSLHNRNGKQGLSGNGGGSVTGGSDLYDPDQPLWANDSLDASSALPVIVDKNDHLSDQDNSERLGKSVSTDNGRVISNSGAAAASQSSSVRRNINNFKSRSGKREKVDMNLTLKAASHSDSGCNSRIAPLKAVRTLYVSGIPWKDNKVETLLVHFKKFGDVIDIHTPKATPDRAFVQFLKREDAEAALKAPDAVMGNRFIRLQWANRDSVITDTDDVLNSVSSPGPRVTTTSPLIMKRGKDNVQIPESKNSVARSTVTSLPGSDLNGTQATPPLQKKMEALELLKEELRKKQEMFDKKRSEFKRKLNELEEQTSGPKDEVASDQSCKRQKGSTLVDVAKIEMSRSSHSGTVDSPGQMKVTTDSGRSVESIADPGFKSSSIVTVPDPSTLKGSIRPLAPVGAPFVFNRFKIDNRPTAFKILPPLPPGLANVSALKDHFSAYGELSLVEVEDAMPQDTDNELETTKISGRVSFKNRRSAEMAFLNGKSWQGESLNFVWLPSSSSNASKDSSGKEAPTATMKEFADADGDSDPLAASKKSSNANAQSDEEVAATEVTTTSTDGDSEIPERREDDGKPSD